MYSYNLLFVLSMAKIWLFCEINIGTDTIGKVLHTVSS